MTETEETVLTVALGLGVLWLLVTPAPSTGVVTAPAPAPSGGSPAAPARPLLYNDPSIAGIVAQAKADVENAGVDLSDICGAFQITLRSIDLIRQQRGWPAGKLSKPTGTNCDGYAVDIVAFPNGEIYDMIVGKTSVNGPAWNADDPVDPSRYVA